MSAATWKIFPGIIWCSEAQKLLRSVSASVTARLSELSGSGVYRWLVPSMLWHQRCCTLLKWPWDLLPTVVTPTLIKLFCEPKVFMLFNQPPNGVYKGRVRLHKFSQTLARLCSHWLSCYIRPYYDSRGWQTLLTCDITNTVCPWPWFYKIRMWIVFAFCIWLDQRLWGVLTVTNRRKQKEDFHILLVPKPNLSVCDI